MSDTNKSKCLLSIEIYSSFTKQKWWWIDDMLATTNIEYSDDTASTYTSKN